MKFEEALKAMREGKAVTRPIYDCYFVMENNAIQYVYKNSDKRRFVLGAMVTLDILAEDWEIVDE